MPTNIAYLLFFSASDDFEESTRDDQTKPPPEVTLDPPPTLVYTDMGEQLGYSSTGFNNASISINQVSSRSSSRLIRGSGVDT